MYTVWKYVINPIHQTIIKMPAHAQILSVQVQSETLCLWALVNTDELMTVRLFQCYITGEPIDVSTQKYVGTCLMDDGQYVLHIFEEVR